MAHSKATYYANKSWHAHGDVSSIYVPPPTVPFSCIHSRPKKLILDLF